MKKNFLYWSLFFVAAILFGYYSAEIDLSIANYFYDFENHHFSKNKFFDFVYHWGVLPGQIAGLISAAVLVLSYPVKYLKKWRKPALMLVLTMSIGAGVITHSFLKDHWGRPRPKQVDLYGGTQPFSPFYKPNLSLKIDTYKSFPCGHCTMGFFFIAFAFLGLHYRNRILFWSGVLVAIILGSVLSLARIAQGGHFFSDTVASAIILFGTAWICYWILFKEDNE